MRFFLKAFNSYQLSSRNTCYGYQLLTRMWEPLILQDASLLLATVGGNPAPKQQFQGTSAQTGKYHPDNIIWEWHQGSQGRWSGIWANTMVSRVKTPYSFTQTPEHHPQHRQHDDITSWLFQKNARLGILECVQEPTSSSQARPGYPNTCIPGPSSQGCPGTFSFI